MDRRVVNGASGGLGWGTFRGIPRAEAPGSGRFGGLMKLMRMLGGASRPCPPLTGPSLHSWCGAIILLSAALPVSTTAAATWASELVAPQTLIQRTSEELRAAILREQELIKKDPNRAVALVNQIVVPHIDSLAVGKRILGKYWRKALPEQRERFIDNFRKLLLRTYAVSVGRYSDVEVTYLPIRDTDQSGSRAKVRTTVSRAGRPPINVDYRLHRTGNGWKVYDVATNGISLVATFRATVDAEVRKHGLDGLLERLKPITPQ